MYKNLGDNFLGIESLHNFGNKDPVECVGVKNVPLDMYKNIVTSEQKNYFLNTTQDLSVENSTS